MARYHARRTKARGGSESKRDHGHGVEIGHHVAPAGDRGDIGRADLFERLDRPAAARAVDHADDRQLELVRHLLGLHHLAADPGIRRAAANGEIIGGGNHRAAVDLRLAEQEGGRKDGFEIAVFVVAALARDLADFAEGAVVAQRGEPGAGIHLAPAMLASDLVGSAHLLGQRLAPAQFLEFFFPSHARRIPKPSPQRKLGPLSFSCLGRAIPAFAGRTVIPLRARQLPARPRPAPVRRSRPKARSRCRRTARSARVPSSSPRAPSAAVPQSPGRPRPHRPR